MLIEIHFSNNIKEILLFFLIIIPILYYFLWRNKLRIRYFKYVLPVFIISSLFCYHSFINGLDKLSNIKLLLFFLLSCSIIVGMIMLTIPRKPKNIAKKGEKKTQINKNERLLEKKQEESAIFQKNNVLESEKDKKKRKESREKQLIKEEKKKHEGLQDIINSIYIKQERKEDL
jgi:hypothetical protein